MGTAPGEKVRDVRGIEIEPGDRVVSASMDRRLHVNIVKLIERPDEAVPFVRFTSGGYTTPDRLAVVQKGTAPERGRISDPTRESDGCEEHVTTVGTDSGGWRASCTCSAHFPWHQIGKEGPRAAKSSAQQDAVEHLRAVRS